MKILTQVEHRLVEKAVRDLNAIYREKALETACLLGEYVISHFFGGDFQAIGKRGCESASFRALANHPDLRFSASYLWTAVAVVKQLHELPEELGRRLPLSHHRLLLPVKDAARKLELAQRAVNGNLSKRELECEIQNNCGHRPKSRPKPSADPKLSRSLANLINASEEFVLAATSGKDQLNSDGVQGVGALLRRVEVNIDAVRCAVAMLRLRLPGKTDSVSPVSPGKHTLSSRVVGENHLL